MANYNHIRREDLNEYPSQDDNADIADIAELDILVERGGCPNDQNDLRKQIADEYIEEYKKSLDKVQREILRRTL